MTSKKYMQLIRSFGCIICERPAEVHHCRSMAGMGQKNSDFLTIPLCPEHHRTGPDAVHNNTRNERELLSRTIEKVVTHLNNQRIPF